MSRTLYSILLILTSVSVLSQECLKKLEDAQRAYFDGKINLVIELIEPCLLNNSLENNDQETGYRLIINSLLIQNDDSAAEVYMKQLLNANPLSEVRSNDLTQYKNLHQKFQINPRWNLGFVLGPNKASFSTLQYRSLGSITEEEDQYDTKTGISFGLKIDRYVTQNFFLSSGLFYSRYSYKLQEFILTYQQVFIEERLSYLAIPITVGLEYPGEKLDVFIKGGLAFNAILTSKADLELFGIATEDEVTVVPGIPEKAENINLSYQRKNITFNYQLAAGARKKLGLYGIECYFQYDLGANNLVETSERYANEEVWSKYSYVSNDFKMDAITLMIGLTRRFSTPVKRKNP